MDSIEAPITTDSTITTVPFGVVENGFTDDDIDEAITDGRCQGLADEIATVPDQRQREGATERGAVVAGGDVAQHGHRLDARVHRRRVANQVGSFGKPK